MFFFIGGIQPRTVTVDDTARLCPSCGLAQARLKRVDHYLSLFFIPLFPVKRGEEVLICDRCRAVTHPGQPPRGRDLEERPRGSCPGCGAAVEPAFSYCPQCGTRL